MRDDIAPEWPQPHISIAPKTSAMARLPVAAFIASRSRARRAFVANSELAEEHDHDLGARIAGSSRMVNAIPAVYAAPPGLLSALDLPLITGTGLVRPVEGPAPDSRLFATSSTGRAAGGEQELKASNPSDGWLTGHPASRGSPRLRCPGDHPHRPDL